MAFFTSDWLTIDHLTYVPINILPCSAAPIVWRSHTLSKRERVWLRLAQLVVGIPGVPEIMKRRSPSGTAGTSAQFLTNEDTSRLGSPFTAERDCLQTRPVEAAPMCRSTRLIWFLYKNKPPYKRGRSTDAASNAPANRDDFHCIVGVRAVYNTPRIGQSER